MKIQQAIYDYWALLDNDPPRQHLGASLIGHECERFLWLVFHWAFAAKFGGRMHRLFEFGRQSEDRFCSELAAVGVRVCQTSPDGKQFNFLDASGHFGGSMDGCAEINGEWHVVEFKTHGDKSFKELEAKGVAEAKPQHFVQMQVYMGMSGIKKAFYYAENKNTSEVWAEVVAFDQVVFDWAMERARRVVFGQSPAEKIGGPDWYQCKWCDAYQLCHGTAVPKKNCRTCIHSTAVNGGKWECRGYEIPSETMATGCGFHVFIPSLLPWDPVDGDEGWVMYDIGGGLRVCNAAEESFPTVDNGAPPAIFSSDELVALGDLSKVGKVSMVKAAFGGEVVGNE